MKYIFKHHNNYKLNLIKCFMKVIYGIPDKEKEKIKTLFERVGIYTAGENKVNVTLKGIGEFYITPEEHESSPSYVSGLPYAYQFFKGEGKELNFEDLINMKISEPYFYSEVPNLARKGLTALLQNKKLAVVYQGLKGKDYSSKDEELSILYESAKAFGNKSSAELSEIYKKFEYSFLDRGFVSMFNNVFGKNYLSSNEKLKEKFQAKLFDSIRDKSFITSVNYGEIDLSTGFRGNEYIKLLQKIEKYKTK